MANKFWVGGDGNWSDAANHWATSSNGTPGAGNAPTSVDVCIFDGNSGAGTGLGSGAFVTVDAAIDVDTITLAGGTGNFAGTLDTNDQTVTCGKFVFSGTGTRKLDLGASVITCDAGSGLPWDIATTTGLTFVAGTSHIKLIADATTTRTFSGGGLTYYDVTIQNTSSTNPQTIFTFPSAVNNSFNKFAFVGQLDIQLPSGATQTCEIFSALGTSYKDCIGLRTTSTTSQATISVNTSYTGNWCTLRNIALTGTGTGAFLNSLDGGKNTGMTILGPQPYHVI